jgi:2'-phosphotransferase
MRDVDKDMVLRLVAENAKQRFELFYGLDPSPPIVKAKKGQGKGKGKGGPKPKLALKGQSPAGLEGEKSAATGDAAETGERKVETVDAAQVDDLRKELSEATLQDPKPISTELPLISIPIPPPEGGDASSSGTTPVQAGGSTGEYFIRATQGHTIKVETAALLEEVKNDEEGRTKAGVLVHGTRWELWEVLSESFSPPLASNSSFYPLSEVQPTYNTWYAVLTYFHRRIRAVPHGEDAYPLGARIVRSSDSA